jgi:hypothetical protein
MTRTHVPSRVDGATIQAWRDADTASLCAATIDDWYSTAAPGNNEVLFVRHAVRTAGPRHPKEATRALNYCYPYASWRTHNQLALDVANPFNDHDVNTYLTERFTGRPTGTVDAIRSNLRRLAPGIGFAGTTRTATHTTRPAAPTIEAIPATVEEAISSFTPQMVHSSMFAAVADVVRNAVRAAQPSTPNRACDLMRHASYLAAWAHAQQLPVREDTVFAALTIEDFIDVVNQVWPRSSVRTIAANLHHLRDAVGLPLDVTRRSFSKDEPKAPYTQSDVEGFYARAASIPSKKRREYVHVALDLIFGAGITAAAVGFVQPDDIIAAAGTVSVRCAGPGDDPEVPLEHIRLLEPHALALARARFAANERGDNYMIGGSTSRRDRRCSSLFKPDNDRFGIRIDMTRARLTWAYHAGKAMCENHGGVDVLRALLRNPTVIDALERDLS